jgi:hypothetical protein
MNLAYDLDYDDMTVISMGSYATIPDLNQIGNGTVEEYLNFAVMHNISYPNLSYEQADDNDDIMSLVEDEVPDDDSSLPSLEWGNDSVVTVPISGVPIGKVQEPIDVIIVEHDYSVIGGVVYIHDG